MEKEVINAVHAILDKYLETNNHRKTPERYAVLDSVFGLNGRFSIERLSEELERKNFRVSRATLYNTLKLFLKLRLVVRHHLPEGIKYEASYTNSGHIHQVCNVCGKVTEIDSPEITQAINDTKYGRFHKDSFMLYVYGVCSKCQSKLSRHRSTKSDKSKKQ
jgi:Fur family ferric uptake transcriptional regulator